ncbi:hypothetical protein LOAG_11259, partial [Loa loa]
MTLDCCRLNFGDEALVLATNALMAQKINAGERSSITRGRTENLRRRKVVIFHLGDVSSLVELYPHTSILADTYLFDNINIGHIDQYIFRIARRQRWWKRSRNPDID